MEELIEYDIDGKETNKVTSFSSSDEHTWDTDNGTESTFQGLNAYSVNYILSYIYCRI